MGIIPSPRYVNYFESLHHLHDTLLLGADDDGHQDVPPRSDNLHGGDNKLGRQAECKPLSLSISNLLIPHG